MADLQALKNELDTDPLTRGYAGMDDGQAAHSLTNTLDRVVSRETLTGSEVLNATNDVEFDALTDAQKNRWVALCAVDQINTTSGVAKKLAIEFGAQSSTVDNLVALRDETVSRAAELGLGGVNVQDVTKARAL